MKKTRWIAGLAACVMAVQALPAGAVQAEDTELESGEYTENGVTYSYAVYEDEAILMGCEGYGSSLTLPETLGGAPLCYIYEYVFQDAAELTEIVLPDTLCGIFEGAFIRSGLTQIAFPESLLFIDSSAFSTCSGLTEVTLPLSVLELGDYVFHDCDALERVTMDSALYNCGERVFYGCDALSSLTLNETVCFLGDEMFSSCPSLTAVTLPASLEGTGEEVFAYTGVTEVTIPNSWGQYGEGMFAGCTALTKASFEEDSYYVPARCFSGCKALTDVTLSSEMFCIEEAAFLGCTGLTELDLSAVMMIEDAAFSGCTGLTGLPLSEGLIYIGEEAFYNCNFLLDMEVPSSVFYIGPRAFQDTAFLDAIEEPAVVLGDGVLYLYQNMAESEIVLPEGIQYVAPEAFKNVTTNSITFQDGLYAIYENAFALAAPTAQDSLETVVLPDSLEYIGENAFRYRVGLANVADLSNVTYIGRNAFEGTAFLDGNTEEFVIMGDGILYEYQGTATEVTVPDTVQYLGANSFAYNMTIETLHLPEGLLEIQNYACIGCTQLSSVNFPATLVYIGESAFQGDRALTEVVFDCGAYTEETYLEIDFDAFMSTGLTSVELPEYCFLWDGAFGLDSDGLPVEGFTIYGVAYSFPYYYAEQYGFAFVDVNGMLGDVNGDGAVDSDDAVLLLKLYADSLLSGETEFDAAALGVGDIDGNGVIDSDDAVLVLKYYTASMLGEASWDVILAG